MDQQFDGTRPQPGYLPRELRPRPRDTKTFPLWFKAWLGVCLIASCGLGVLVAWALIAVINHFTNAPQCAGA